MSTIEDFENAPVGAMATHEDGGRAMKMDDVDRRWGLPGGLYLRDRDMVQCNYTLDPAVPTTAREALDLAWELAHPVKEGQTIPEGTHYLHQSELYPLTAGTVAIERLASRNDEATIRTVDPLPDPEPDWLDAPAVIAIAESFSHRRIWVSLGDGDWASIQDGGVHWHELRDVTPLWPKGQDA